MKILLSVLMFFAFLSFQAQEGFIMDENKTSIKIPFQLLSNLIFVNVNVNGANLTFLVDTGVAETVLFSLDESQTVIFDQVERLQLKGMGSQAPIEALVAKNNKLKMPHYYDDNHDILIVLNQEVNFSPNVGIPVNGILGYHFFRNYLVEIDYQRKHIIIRKPVAKTIRRLRKFENFPIEIIKDKPYVEVLVKSGKSETLAKVLVDNGNSDALWLFANRTSTVQIPDKNIPDFLGRGFSGDIYGEKARIDYLKIGRYEFKDIITSFPDSISTQNINTTIDRLGSIGGEVLRRFDQIFDYKNNFLYLKPNKNFEQDFLYDKSGIELQHDGMEWVKERVDVQGHYKGEVFDGTGEKITNSFAYKFDLKPIYKIFNVRTSSAAEAAGIKVNDQLISVNGKIAYKLTLDQITKLLRGPDDKIIKLEILREGKVIPILFRLRTML